MEILPGPGWDDLAGEIVGRTVLLIGRAGLGKSSLARYLVGRLASAGEPVCLVDSDIGQSALGLPGTVSMKLFRNKGDLTDYSAQEIFFVGTLSPARRIWRVVEGARRMLGRCGGTTVVDTTGLVDGDAGRELKLLKIKTLEPDYIVAIGRGDELEHILDRIEGPVVRRMRPSVHARQKGRAQRARYREEKYMAYFRGSGVLAFYPRSVAFASDGSGLDIMASPAAEGSVAGLGRGEETLALGIFLGVEGGKVIIRTPHGSPDDIDTVRFGDILFEGFRSL